jgi:hypothetical protein
MRLFAIPFVLTGLFILSVGARAGDCKSLQPQSEQIACLQLEVEQLRDEVERLRSSDAKLEQWIDARIKSALTNLEPRVQQLGK